MTLLKNISPNNVRLSDGTLLAAGAQKDVVIGAYETAALRRGHLQELSDPTKWAAASGPVVTSLTQPASLPLGGVWFEVDASGNLKNIWANLGA